MADIFTARRRSTIMALVRSTGNESTERRLAKLLRSNGLNGWRRGRRLPGSPDFVWPRERITLFVDGCFWHCCPQHGHVPRSRLAYWSPKLRRNAERDHRVTRQLRAAGWRVLRIWECALLKRNQPQTLRRIARVLRERQII
jgi:DNA mismatch endonuclease, patch repair protein